jgi:hypothetical protein
LICEGDPSNGTLDILDVNLLRRRFKGQENNKEKTTNADIAKIAKQQYSK